MYLDIAGLDFHRTAQQWQDKILKITKAAQREKYLNLVRLDLQQRLALNCGERTVLEKV